MTHRLLSGKGFNALSGEMQPGEVLVAHWLRDPLNNPCVDVVSSEGHHDGLVAKAEAGYYNELTFFASTNFSENPYDYDKNQSPATPTTSGAPANPPTVEELVAKALDANVIDASFAEELRASEDLEEALGMFFTYVIQEDKGDPEALLTSWGITE